MLAVKVTKSECCFRRILSRLSHAVFELRGGFLNGVDTRLRVARNPLSFACGQRSDASSSDLSRICTQLAFLSSPVPHLAKRGTTAMEAFLGHAQDHNKIKLGLRRSSLPKWQTEASAETQCGVVQWSLLSRSIRKHHQQTDCCATDQSSTDLKTTSSKSDTLLFSAARGSAHSHNHRGAPNRRHSVSAVATEGATMDLLIISKALSTVCPKELGCHGRMDRPAPHQNSHLFGHRRIAVACRPHVPLMVST